MAWSLYGRKKLLFSQNSMCVELPGQVITNTCRHDLRHPSCYRLLYIEGAPNAIALPPIDFHWGHERFFKKPASFTVPLKAVVVVPLR
ncbi:hypothetical protein HNQ65_001126 [Prosthecobacter vanneervenii]|uniref:Uncharacterized protein n=1 Tax=Prosthecobacter vanneervenii TaxID=48466 RepID=A0A7W7Y8F8_9BACT|nr:hypothetical protein [Prosthecobacter vanneervenii]